MAGYNYMNGGYYAIDRNKAGNAATNTERVVEHVLAPVVVTEYQYTSQAAKVESMKNFGVTGEKWRRPSNPAHDRPQVGVTEIGYGSPIEEVKPVKVYGVTGNKWGRPSNPVHDRPQVAVNEYGYGPPIKVEPMKDSVVTGLYSPPEVDEFITKVQTEASRPTRPGVLSATNWRNMPNGNTIREPTMTSKEGWEERPSCDTPLSGPTNDIGKAMEMLKEAVKPSPVTAAAPPQPRFAVPASTVPKRDTYIEVIDSREAARRYAPPQPQFAVPASTVLKRDTYTEVIDSREAARRYGNFNQSSRPFQTGETHTGTINSKEAAKKYNGTLV